jgi:hypothetical protein
MEQEPFNVPVPSKKLKGPKEPGSLTRRVRLELVWEGTELEARAFAKLQKTLITELYDTGDRPLVMRLRQSWLVACEKAGVRDC